MSMDPKRLTAIPLFSGVAQDEASRLAAFATETSVAEGQILVKEGDYSTELIAVEEGSADVIKGGQIVATLGPGDIIGETGLMTREPRNADVIATSSMLVIRLTHWEVRRMSKETIEKIEDVIRERQASGSADPSQ